MLKIPGSKTFVAVLAVDDKADNTIIGWSYAEVSPSMSLILSGTAGIIRAIVIPEKTERAAAARSLVYRAQWWLLRQKSQHILVEILPAMSDLAELFGTMRLAPDTTIQLLRADSL
jgi:hypothetical protein